jgi:oligosaccharide repeat unit polymerase
LIGLIFQTHIKKIKEIHIKKRKTINKTLFVIFGFFCEFVYCGYIPLLGGSKNNTYQDFGIPTFHVILVTFSIYFAIVLFLQFLVYRKKRDLLQLFAMLFMYLLIMSRGILMFLCIIFAFIYLASHKISFKLVVIMLLLSFIALYIFGILGNIRSGSEWYDSSYIIALSKIDEDRFFLPKPFVWAYVYIISPLGNLNDQFIGLKTDSSFIGVFSNLIFDFISKRIIKYDEPSIPYAEPQLVVRTCYSDVYASMNIFGMFYLFIFMILFTILSYKLASRKTECMFIALTILSTLMLLTFFDNVFAFSGYSFTVIYPILLSHIKSNKRCYKNENLDFVRTVL